MFYKRLLACLLTFKLKLTVTGSGKTSPRKNAPERLELLQRLGYVEILQQYDDGTFTE